MSFSYLLYGEDVYVVSGPISSSIVCISSKTGSLVTVNTSHIWDPDSHQVYPIYDKYVSVENGLYKIEYSVPYHKHYNTEKVTAYLNDSFLYHRMDGPAKISHARDGTCKTSFYIDGKEFTNAEDWFNSLTPEEQKKAIFNLDEIKND